MWNRVGYWGARNNSNSPGAQEPGCKRQDPGARTPPHTHRLAQLPRFNARGRRAGRKEGAGWREGPELLGATVGEQGMLRELLKWESPRLPPLARVWALLPPARVAPTPAGLGRCGGELGPSFPWAALPGLALGPEPGPPSVPASGAARQGATCQRTLGEPEGRRGASCALRPGCSFLLLSPPPLPPPQTSHTTERDTRTFARPTIPGPSIRTLVDCSD